MKEKRIVWKVKKDAEKEGENNGEIGGELSEKTDEKVGEKVGEIGEKIMKKVTIFSGMKGDDFFRSNGEILGDEGLKKGDLHNGGVGKNIEDYKGLKEVKNG